MASAEQLYRLMDVGGAAKERAKALAREVHALLQQEQLHQVGAAAATQAESGNIIARSMMDHGAAPMSALSVAMTGGFAPHTATAGSKAAEVSEVPSSAVHPSAVHPIPGGCNEVSLIIDH